MKINEARETLRIFESGDERPGGSFGPLQWVINYRAMSQAGKAECHAVARALVVEGTREERRYALEFWGAVSLPPGASDELGRLYLSETPPDPELRRFLGLYTGHVFSPDVAEALVHRFVASPQEERELAGAVVAADASGRAWEAFSRLVQQAGDLRTLNDHLNTAYRAGRIEGFCALIARKPRAILDPLIAAIPLPALQAAVRSALAAPNT
jgi:hypothetical protein